MMENYQETCNKSNRTEQLDVICRANTMEARSCASEIANEENYNFGAEITKHVDDADNNVDDGDDNNEIKTNAVENVTSTKTEQPCATTNDEDSTQYVHHSQPNCADSVDSSDDDTSTSTDSDFSDLSGLSDVSGKEWKPVNRKPILWVQKQIHSGRNPRELLSRFLPAGAQSITLGLNDMSLWRLLANMLAEPPRRQKLRYVNTFEDVIKLILNSKNIVVLTGAGVSVSCGIPDFRSSDGIYSRLAKDYPNLPDPQAMFDIDYFSRDPRPFYKFAREIYPGQFKPSPCHRFIKLLEDKQILLRNYTQNIDTLEQVAGIKRVIECHGSFSTASCTKCKFKCDADAIRADIFAQRIPVCPRCQPHVHQSVDASQPVSEYDLRWVVANGIMKPDIVFFGEGLPDEFHKVMASDKDKCDLLIVIGSSLKVRPVALIPSSLPAHVPQILINREQLNHLEFDVELLGDSDVIINQICHRLGADWKQICFDEAVLQESKELQPFENDDDDDDDDEFDDSDENQTDSERQLTEIDFQTVKSNVSVGLSFSASTTTNAACSDSGFESSTSISQTECIGTESSTTMIVKSNRNVDELAEIENIKTSILEFSERPAASDDNDFQPFSVRCGQDTLMTPPTSTTSDFGNGSESLRHLSIDSTKDSGIQCDSSNSMVTTATLSTEIEFNETACSSSAAALKTETEFTKTQENSTQETQSDTLKRPRKPKSCSAAEFLIDGTYYYHKNSSSYVFPGAQISWYADSCDTDDSEQEQCDDTKAEKTASRYDDNEKDEAANCDTSEAELEKGKPKNSVDSNTNSPLRADCGGLKRNATQNMDEININSCTNEAPAPKKCRLDAETESEAITPPATTILTTTINTSTAECSSSIDVTSLHELEATAGSRSLTLPGAKEALQDI